VLTLKCLKIKVLEASGRFSRFFQDLFPFEAYSDLNFCLLQKRSGRFSAVIRILFPFHAKKEAKNLEKGNRFLKNAGKRPKWLCEPSEFS